MRAAILVVSTSRSKGEAEDDGGPALAAFASDLGCEVATVEVVPDDVDAIEPALLRFADDERVSLILTTGGTGFAASDVTPEATLAVIERETPGIAEAMRAASREHTNKWMLSRGVAGIRGDTLIINFPGNPKSIVETGIAIAAALPHALDLLAGRPSSH